MYNKPLMDTRKNVISAANKLRASFDYTKISAPRLKSNIESIQRQSKGWHDETTQKGLCLAAQNFAKRLRRMAPDETMFHAAADNFAALVNELRNKAAA